MGDRRPGREHKASAKVSARYPCAYCTLEYEHEAARDTHVARKHESKQHVPRTPEEAKDHIRKQNAEHKRLSRQRKDEAEALALAQAQAQGQAMDVVIPDLAPAGAAVVTVQPGPGKGGSKRNRSGAAAGGKGVMESVGSQVTPMEVDPGHKDEPPSVAVPFLRQGPAFVGAAACAAPVSRPTEPLFEYQPSMLVQGKVGMAYAASARGPLGVLITVAPRGIQDALVDVRSSVDPDTRLMIERGVYSVIKDAHTWRETLRLWGLEHMIIPGDWLGDVTIGVSFAPLDIVPQGASIGLAVAVAMASWLTGLVVRPDTVITGAVTLDGMVHPVDELPAKITTAKAQGAKRICMPSVPASAPLAPEVRFALEHVSCATLHLALKGVFFDINAGADMAHLTAARALILGSGNNHHPPAIPSTPSAVAEDGEEVAPDGGDTSATPQPPQPAQEIPARPILEGRCGTLVNAGEDGAEGPTILLGHVMVMAWKGSGKVTLLGCDNPAFAALTVERLQALRSSGVLRHVHDPQDYDLVMDVPEALRCKPTTADFTGALLLAMATCLSPSDVPDAVYVCAPLAGIGDEIKHGREELAAPHAPLLIKALQSELKRVLVVPRGAVAALQAAVHEAKAALPRLAAMSWQEVRKASGQIEVVGVSTAEELLRAVVPSSLAEDPGASTRLLALSNVNVYKLPDWDGKEAAYSSSRMDELEASGDGKVEGASVVIKGDVLWHLSMDLTSHTKSVLSVPLRFDTLRLHEVGVGGHSRLVLEVRDTRRQHYLIAPRDDDHIFKLLVIGKLVPGLIRPVKKPLSLFPSDHIQSLQGYVTRWLGYWEATAGDADCQTRIDKTEAASIRAVSPIARMALPREALVSGLL